MPKSKIDKEEALKLLSELKPAPSFEDVTGDFNFDDDDIDKVNEAVENNE